MKAYERIISDSRPLTTYGVLWINSSKEPYTLNIFENGKWHEIGVDSAEGAAEHAEAAAAYARQQGLYAKGIYDAVKAAYESGELKGQKGDTGAQGSKGDKGEKGDTGETGANGVDGSVLWPALVIDKYGYLSFEIPDESENSNFGLDEEGFLTMSIPDIFE